MTTNIRVISEAGIAINFQVESNLPAARQNIETLLKMRGRTSSTIMAGLLAVSPTKPIQSEADVCHPLLIVNFRNRTLGVTKDKETITDRFNDIGCGVCNCHERDSSYTCEYCKLTYGSWGHKEDMATPEDWCDIFDTKIMDPDGWRKDNKSFDERLYVDDFVRRWAASTARQPGNRLLQAVLERLGNDS